MSYKRNVDANQSETRKLCKNDVFSAVLLLHTSVAKLLHAIWKMKTT